MSDNIVKLNIGGKKFITSTSTLTNRGPNFFSGLLSGKIQSSMLGDYYFIDRDGECFKPLLNFLRSGELFIPPNVDPKQVRKEAEFYSIDLPEEIVKKEEYEYATLQFEGLTTWITSKGKECKNQTLYLTTREISKAIGSVAESSTNKFLALHKSKLLCKELNELGKQGWELVPQSNNSDLYLLKKKFH